MRFGALGLDVFWNSINLATDYDVELDDSNGNAVDPQPAITRFGSNDFTHAQIANESLLDQTTYKIRVRASAGASRSAWSAQAEILVDKSKPESTLLQALLIRLHAAGTNFDLGPDVVQSGNITGQFASLLGMADGKLSVREAQITSTFTSVTLSATLDLFHVTGATGTFVFTDQKAIIQLNMSYPLGTCTIAQLKTAALLPEDTFGETAWADTLAALDGTVLELDTALRRLTVTSATDSPTWSVLGLPNVSLGSVRPELQVIAPLPDTEKQFIPRVLTELDLGLSEKLPVYLQLPAGATPWQSGLRQAYYVGNLTDIYKLFGGQPLSLPQGIINLGQLTLDAFTVTHAPNSSIWSWELAATLGVVPGVNGSQAPGWTIITNVLELKNMGFAVHVDVISAANNFLTSSWGAISASFILGNLTPLDIALFIPGLDGVWTLLATTNQALQLSQTAQP